MIKLIKRLKAWLARQGCRHVLFPGDTLCLKCGKELAQ